MSEKTFGPFELQKAYNNEPVPADFVERRRISAAMQTLAERLIRAEGDIDTLSGWADQLEALVATVGEPDRRDTRASNRKLFTGSATTEDIFHMMDYDPVGGPSNPIAPQVEWLQEDQNGIEGALRLGLQYQGPPGGCTAA